MDSKEKICECGDMESQHIDSGEQCVIPECGCREFEEQESSDIQVTPREDRIENILSDKE